MSLPLTSATSEQRTTAEGTTAENEQDATAKLEALHAMASDLSVQAESLCAEAGGVLEREKSDEAYRTRRRLWELFLQEPDKLKRLLTSF